VCCNNNHIPYLIKSKGAFILKAQKRT